MKKVMFFILAFALFSSVALSGTLGGSQVITTSDGTSTLAIASTATVYTGSFPLNQSEYFGLWLKAVSTTGTPDITVELEQSYRRPTTEGSADTSFVEPDGLSNLFTNLTTETAHIIGLNPVPAPYGRLKITGNSGNPADTVVTAYLFTQGNI